jgi:hypothetical protein
MLETGANNKASSTLSRKSSTDAMRDGVSFGS